MPVASTASISQPLTGPFGFVHVKLILVGVGEDAVTAVGDKHAESILTLSINQRSPPILPSICVYTLTNETYTN